MIRWVFFITFLSPFSAFAAPFCPHEDTLSARTIEHIRNEWSLHIEGDTIDNYFNSLGSKLAPKQDILNLSQYIFYDWPSRWKILAVRDKASNALSVGSGQIYIFDGVILAAENESQIAAIIAHEMAHQLAGHFCNTQENDEQTSRMIGTLIQSIDADKEIEADLIAMDVLVAAGYPASVMVDAIRRMSANDLQNQHLAQQRIQAILPKLTSFAPIAAQQSSNDFYSIKRYLQQQ